MDRYLTANATWGRGKWVDKRLGVVDSNRMSFRRIRRMMEIERGRVYRSYTRRISSWMFDGRRRTDQILLWIPFEVANDFECFGLLQSFILRNNLTEFYFILIDLFLFPSNRYFSWKLRGTINIYSYYSRSFSYNHYDYFQFER